MSGLRCRIHTKRLVCHCTQTQSCHADALIQKFRELFPQAYDRNDPTQRAPTSEELNLLARHREEPPSDDGSSSDEGVPGKNSGWVGVGPPMQVGVGYTSRDFRDGQGLCKTELLMALAVGKVEDCPFNSSEVRSFKERIVADLEQEGLGLGRQEGDREDVPIDFRFLGLLLRAAEDPERGLGQFAQGVPAAPGTKMPRLPALYRPKRRWRLASQRDPRAYLKEKDHGGETVWRRNYATVQPLAKDVFAVLDDQTRRGMFLRLPEAEAKARYPRLVIASHRKDRPNGEVTARVLHDGTNGHAVNTNSRLRDQERCPISSDLKRAMREKGNRGLHTFALTADVKEAHRQIPIDPRDWHFLSCQPECGADVFINTVGTFGITTASY